MSKNQASGSANDTLLNEIKRFRKELEALRTDQNSTFVLPKVANSGADPTTFVNGQMWYRIASDEVIVVKGGTKRVVTTS